MLIQRFCFTATFACLCWEDANTCLFLCWILISIIQIYCFLHDYILYYYITLLLYYIILYYIILYYIIKLLSAFMMFSRRIPSHCCFFQWILKLEFWQTFFELIASLKFLSIFSFVFLISIVSVVRTFSTFPFLIFYFIFFLFIFKYFNKYQQIALTEVLFLILKLKFYSFRRRVFLIFFARIQHKTELRSCPKSKPPDRIPTKKPSNP